MTQTYTLIYCAFSDREPGAADDLLIGVARDGDDTEVARQIAVYRKAVGDYREGMEEDDPRRWYDDWPIEMQPGLVLTDEKPEDENRIFWRGDVPGETVYKTYKYAVHAKADPEAELEVWRASADQNVWN